MASGPGSCLLRLPDPCLLAVMQCCAHDSSSLLSAATAHSRLQRAAVEALSSISVSHLHHLQARVDSLLLYLAKHGQHVRGLDLHGRGCDRWAASVDVQLPELPPSLTKLDSLQLEGMALQVQPGLPGVLRAGLPLTRLELSRCTLRGQAQELAAALAQLPDLQHLSACDLLDETTGGVPTMHIFPTDALSQLTKLTSLKLEGVSGQDSSSNHSAVLQALMRLADLQLGPGLRGGGGMPTYEVTAGVLAGADQLTRLVLSEQRFEPRALAGKAQLQHLALRVATWRLEQVQHSCCRSCSTSHTSHS